MKISIVTISYNQADFLRAALDSVVTQERSGYELEYIVVDPGSNDGSRDLIESYGSAITKTIFEPDAGPADGLNKGFAAATGDVYGFLNADDLLLPGALRAVAAWFRARPDDDVIIGNGFKCDESGRLTRPVISESFRLKRFGLGACVFLQQATFFRARAFHSVGGFRTSNGTCWDGELLADLGMAGFTFANCSSDLGVFRVHGESITSSIAASRKWAEAYRHDRERIAVNILGHRPSRRRILVARQLSRLRRTPRFVLSLATMRTR